MQIADRWMKATNFGEERVDSTVQQVAFGAVEDFALSTGYFDNVRIWFNNKVIIVLYIWGLINNLLKFIKS